MSTGICNSDGPVVAAAQLVLALQTVISRGLWPLTPAVLSVAGVDGVLTSYRTMAGEDFGEYLARVPGCCCLVGSGDPSGGAVEPHHGPRFDLDEGVLAIARDLHLAAAASYAESW